MALVGALLLLAASPAHAYDLTISTGAPGGTYDKVGRAIGRLVSERGQFINLAQFVSEGSVANLRRLESGEAHLAFVQGDILADAVRGRGVFPKQLKHVQALANLYEEALHIVAAPGSGITKLSDLRGKRVFLGSRNSGTNATAQAILLAHGIKPEELLLDTLTGDISNEATPDQGVEALTAGTIDAFFHLAHIHSDPIERALKVEGTRLIPIDPEVVGDLEEGGFIGLGDIYTDDYPGQLEEDIPAVVVKAVLCARDDVPADVVYEVLNLCFEAIAASGAQFAATEAGTTVDSDPLLDGFEVIRDLTPSDAEEGPHTLHAGAVRFYYEQRVVEMPVRVFTGLFVKEIYDFEVESGTFHVKGGIWFRWRGRLESDNESFPFRLTNGELNSVEFRDSEYFGGWTYVYYEIDATMRGKFAMHDYPFDTQQVVLQIEHEHLGADQVEFVADENLDGSKRDLLRSLGSRTVNDWWVSSVRHDTSTFVTPTDLGNPVAEQQAESRSRYTLTIEIKRLLFSYLLKFSVPLLIIGLMTYSVFYVNPEGAETKLLIIIWDLFIAVEYHTYQAETLPQVGYLIKADFFFVIAYVAIFFVLAHTLILDVYYHKDEESPMIKKLSRFAYFAFPILYFGPMVLLTLLSV
jgi:TRAP transporter TAXI family solute receptor